MHAHSDKQPSRPDLRAPSPADPAAGAGTAASGAAADDAAQVWALAAQLTSGLLANPSKGSYSVKDSISLFDEVLHELQSYTRVRSGISASGRSAAATRHDEQRTAAEVQPTMPSVTAPAGATPAPATPAVPARPAPRQPAPVSNIAPLQPVLPGPHVPGLIHPEPQTGQLHPQPPHLPRS